MRKAVQRALVIAVLGAVLALPAAAAVPSQSFSWGFSWVLRFFSWVVDARAKSGPDLDPDGQCAPNCNRVSEHLGPEIDVN